MDGPPSALFHLLPLVVWGMLFMLAYTRGRVGSRAKATWLMSWAFGLGAARELLFALIETSRFFGPPPNPPPSLPFTPILQTTSGPLVLVVLLAGLLLYLSKDRDLAVRHMKIGIALVALMAAGGLGWFVQSPPANHYEAMRRMGSTGAWTGWISVAMVFFGAWLMRRHARQSFRAPWIGALSVLAASRAIAALGAASIERPGPPPLGAEAEVLWLGAAVIIGYLFIRDHGSELREEFEDMQDQIRDQNAQLSKALDELSSSHDKLIELSTIDDLTGVRNRRFFEGALESEWSRANRDELPLTLAIVDIDNFKQVNDQHGHSTGDECLKLVASLLFDAARRPGDVVARLGGDEFVVLLPNTPSEGARTLLERVRAQLAETQPSSLDAPLTVSVGISTCSPCRGKSPTTLLELADKGLYEAKKDGRDRIADFPAADTAASADKAAVASSGQG